ncbi:MAG TPA: stage II sporulation protein E [Bacillales bacterium]|nr:stage II sporulation protein E [Bacillales bacterium]
MEMGKVLDPHTKSVFGGWKTKAARPFNRLKSSLMRKLVDGHVFILFVGFLLGRAAILAGMSPFALPFFATVALLKPRKKRLAFLTLTAGAISAGWWQTLFVTMAIVLFLPMKKIIDRWKPDPAKALPILVFAANMLGRAAFTFLAKGKVTPSDWLLSSVEAGLAFVLTMIFLQSVPLLSTKTLKRSLKNEEIICFIILLASVLTGTTGWFIRGLSVEHVLSDYFVILFAFVGGAAIGSTVGVVVGLILSLANVASLYQMSLLAFAGLLGGLMKEGKKAGVGLGLLIGTLLIGLYGNSDTSLVTMVWEAAVAVGLFFLTPKGLTDRLAAYIPGTREHAVQQQQYLRKIRDVTANRVEHFSSLFQALAGSFSTQDLQMSEDDPEREIDLFLSHVTAETCQTCFLKQRCWERNFDKTYDYMQRIMSEAEHEPVLNDHVLSKNWESYCRKPNEVIQAIHKEMNQYHVNQALKRKVRESRQLVADQLFGVSQVMGDFAREIQKERDTHQFQEDQIVEALREIGLEIRNIDIYSLEDGAVDIEMTIPYCRGRGECEKIIAPMLSDILGETIVVKDEVQSEYPNGICQASFGSAKDFVVETGIANAAKGGAWVSGDSHSTLELGSGKYAIAISDGMGNGVRAHLESSETLKLLQKVLQSGIDETVAIKSVNSILSLRTNDEIFSTLDLAMIDLQNAGAKFLKICSSPSFVKRGDQVRMIEAGNLPMGVIDEFDVDVVSEQLKDGDLLFMMSDGIFEGAENIENNEVWMKRKIRELETDDPQEAADLIMEEVIRTKHGRIDDDMTVVAAKVKHNIPKWAAIPRFSRPAAKKKAQ